MFAKIVQYTCVFTYLISSAPCFGHSELSGNDTPSIGSKAPTITGDVTERSMSILAKARDTNEEVYTNLSSFVCNEEINRFKGPLESDTAKQIDTVTATVSFENGTEHYSDIRQNTRSRPSISSLAGAWSEGEFGTLLRQTQLLMDTQTPRFEAYTELNGVPSAVYEMYVGAQESPWDLEVRSQHYRVPFRTKVWVSETNGEILKIERISTSVPFEVGISEIQWNVEMKEFEINGRTWLLPSVGEYAVMYEETGHREWNIMHFTNYRRYGSEVAIKFQ